MEKHLSTATAACIIAALVFAPFAFGAIEPWAYPLLAVLAYTALAAAVVRAAMLGELCRLVSPMLILGVLALLLVWVQYVKWPVALLRYVSPRAVEIHQAAHSATGAEPPGAVSPSLYPHETRGALIRLSAYVALFVATCAYVRSRKHVTRLAATIVAVGFAVSLFGIVQNLSGTRKIYWWRELYYGGALFGPFFSRNQFATYAGVCLFVGLGLLLARAAQSGGSLRRWREGLQHIMSGRLHQNFLIAFATAVMGAAIFWSLSRGGILSLILSFAGVLVALRVAGFLRGRAAYVAAVAVVMLGWVTYLGWQPVVGRLSTLGDVARDPTANDRWIMCTDAWRIGLAFPVLGTGSGTFLSVYPLYRSLHTPNTTWSPHNEYFGVFAQAGIGGIALALLAMVLLYRRIARGLARRRHPYVGGFLAGGVGALLMVTLHSLVDFPMLSPAVASTTAVASGMLYRTAIIEPRRRKRRRPAVRERALAATAVEATPVEAGAR